MAIHRDMIVTTTGTIEGYEIKAYLGVISAQIVAGTNVFSDIAASFRDAFGGRSASYQKQLAAINEEAIEQLKREATNLRANGIVGIRIDHDEISGSNKSMFMVTANGTAVRIERVELENAPSPESEMVLSGDLLRIIEQKQKLITAAQSGISFLHKRDSPYFFDKSTLQFLCRNKVHEVAPAVLKFVDRLPKEFYSEAELGKEYFHSLTDDQAKEALYPVCAGDYNDSIKDYAYEIISDRDLLDLNNVTLMLRSDVLETRAVALRLLKVHKRSYSSSDIAKLENLRLEVFSTWEKKPRIPKGKRWLCTFCNKKCADPEGPCFYCRRDNYGILDTRPNPDEIIDLLDRRIEVLKQTFGKEDRDTTITVVCPAPNCGKTLTVPARHQGKQGKCPSCGTAMTISSHDHQA